MLALVIYNSFYYSITVLAVMTWRVYELSRDRRTWFLYLRSAAVAVGLAGVLLLPTGLVLLEHRRQGAALSVGELFRPDLSMEGLLYSPYGMGLTLFALYALLAGLTVRRLRVRSIVLLAAVLLPVVSWILNGTLYARAKILMPLLPLVILQMAELLQMILKKRFRIRIWPEILFGAVAVVYAGEVSSRYISGVLLDAALLVIVLWLMRFYNRRRVYAMLLVTPIVCSVYTAHQDNFVSKGEWACSFSSREIEAVATDPWARMDGMEQPLISSNRLLYSGQKSTTMYSSISNQEYSHWFFDILHMPVRINNRVAMLCEANPFQEYLMGVKYLQTTADKVPVGYEIKARKGDSVLAENDHVLPLAYLSTETISEEEFSRLEFPQTLEALLRYTVTESQEDSQTGIKDEKVMSFESPSDDLGQDSHIEEKQPLFSRMEVSDGLEIRREGDTVTVNAEKTGDVTMTLDKPVKDRIVILEFDVKSEQGRRVTIDINGTRNRLSSAGAAYPNGNSRFTYYLTVPEGESLEQLKITYFKGDYELSGFRWYEYPVEELVKRDAVPVVFKDT